MKLTDKQMLMLLGAGLLVALYLKKKAVETVETVGNAVNPVNPDNIFYGGVNAVGEAVTGDSSFSFGSYIYEVLNGE